MNHENNNMGNKQREEGMEDEKATHKRDGGNNLNPDEGQETGSQGGRSRGESMEEQE